MGPRGWLIVLGGVATAAVILTAWLPLGALFAQRDALASATGRLAQLSAGGRALTAEAARLRTPAVQDQLARELYQLVEPGQRLVQVLTPTFRPTASTRSGGPFPGDPGFAPIVDPTDVDATQAASTGGHVEATPAHAARADGPGFASRVLATLEFWR